MTSDPHARRTRVQITLSVGAVDYLAGRRASQIPNNSDAYAELQQALEMARDVLAYDEAKKEGDAVLSSEQMRQELEL